MAIIQSILVGKGKGKIGNVVLSGLKGQTVAKQLNSSPSNPRTVAQTANRVKMSNAVLAWQFLAIFMNYAKGLRKPLESTYNAFVRTIVNFMESVPADNRANAASMALLLQKFSGNWFTILIDAANNDEIKASFNPSGMSWADSYRVVGIFLSDITGTQNVVERALTEAEFSSGEVTLTAPVDTVANTFSLYVYDSATSKITNIPAFQ